MALDETAVCNMALAHLGANQIVDLDTDNTVVAIKCRLLYAATRDDLLRLYPWRFAICRVALTEDDSTPAFHWDKQFVLPDDCLRVLSIDGWHNEYAIEGRLLLTNTDSVNLVYIQQITDPTQFDSMFVKVLTLALAVALVMPLTQDKTLLSMVTQECGQALAAAKLADAREGNTHKHSSTWNEARYGWRRT